MKKEANNIIERGQYVIVDITTPKIIYSEDFAINTNFVSAIAGMVFDFVKNSRAKSTEELNACTDDVMKAIRSIVDFGINEIKEGPAK